MPTDADSAWLKRVHGDLDPGRPVARGHGVGQAADDQMRVEALDTLSKRFKLLLLAEELLCCVDNLLA